MDSTTTLPFFIFDGPRASWENPTFCGAFSASQIELLRQVVFGVENQISEKPLALAELHMANRAQRSR